MQPLFLYTAEEKFTFVSVLDFHYLCTRILFNSSIMKKVKKSVLAAACAVAVAVGFTACENGGEEGPFENKYLAYGAVVDLEGQDLNRYFITLNDTTVTADEFGQVNGGNGISVQLEFFSSGESEPQTGEYTISETATDVNPEDMKLRAGDISTGLFYGTFVVNITDGQVFQEDDPFIAVCLEGECTMTLEKNGDEWTVTADITHLDGTTHEYKYVGPLEFVSGQYN